MTEKIIRCAIYTRKSCEEGLEQDFNSLDAQRLAGENYIASQQHEGWRLISKHYDDGGFSGGNIERPALKELLKDIIDKKIDCIVVYKIDRLSRSLLDFAKLVEIFDKHQVMFVAVTQSFNTSTSMGRLMLHVLLSFAQYEREVTSERIRDKFAASKQKGMWMGGIIPLGYLKDRKLIINQEESHLIEHIFKRFLVLKSPMKLAKELNELGHRTKKRISEAGKISGGQLFTLMHLRGTLTNPLYIGKTTHKGKLYEGQHQAIIDMKTWEEVQNIFQINPHVRGNNSKSFPSLLKQRLRCGTCDVSMISTYTKKQNKHYRYYVCNNHVRGKSCAAEHKTIAAGEVEAFVAGRIREVLKQPEILSPCWETLKGHDISSDKIYEQLSRIDTLWDHLFPIEQQYICHLLIDKVYMHTGGLQIKFHPQCLVELLNHTGKINA